MREARALLSGGPVPIVAIGIAPAATSVMDAGASCGGVADLLSTGDPAARVRDYLSCLNTEAQRHRDSAPLRCV